MSGCVLSNGGKMLSGWAELLLDTGKRNSLINYRDTKSSTVEILAPSSEVFFEKVKGESSFEVVDVEREDEEAFDSRDSPDVKADIELEECDSDKQREELFAKYRSKIKQNQVLPYSAFSKPYKAIKNIDKKARQILDESGVNVAYVAFGFIHWTEDESSHLVFRAPILLLPVRLERKSSVDPYMMKSDGEDVIVNPTFSYKMEAEFGVRLPSYEDEGLAEYLEKVERLASKLHWKVSAECKIGIFSFLKINMYRDLKDNADKILANQNVLRLLGIASCVGHGDAPSCDASLAEDSSMNLNCVVDADSSQIDAIKMAKSGQSFVLQGPPGTGKSQTITNIIAECLSDGKRVLFVSEKLAALNVVYSNLEKAGLAEFCLALHSQKANKKEVISEICRTLRMGRSSLSSKADSEEAALESAKQKLDEYAFELHAQRPVIDKSLYQLYESYSALRMMPGVEWYIPRIESRDEDYLNSVLFDLGQYASYIPSIGYDYRNNIWFGFKGHDLSLQGKSILKNAFIGVVNFCNDLLLVGKGIEEEYGVSCKTLEEAEYLGAFFACASSTQFGTPRLLQKGRFREAESVLSQLEELSLKILRMRAELNRDFDGSVYRLDGDALFERLRNQPTGWPSRLLNSGYRNLVSDLRPCAKTGKGLSHKRVVTAVELLSRIQKAETDFHNLEVRIKPSVGKLYEGVDTCWKSLKEQVSEWGSIFELDYSFEGFERLSDFADEQERFGFFAQRLREVLDQCDRDLFEYVGKCFDAEAFDVLHSPFSKVIERLSGCLQEIDKMDNWCSFRRVISDLEDKDIMPFLNEALDNNLEPKNFKGAFKRLFYLQWIDFVLSDSPMLRELNRVAHDLVIEEFIEKDIEQFEINRARVRARLSADRPNLGLVAGGSALATLLREGEKKRRQKSIRALLSETGEVVQRVKPCFMMSPLSVSTYLDSAFIGFDVVIFDEASQVFPQDAIGAIYRAKQLIVVGDSRQMPPSNFFSASIDAVDDEPGDVGDFESILDLCSAVMPQLRLRWHYRSRCEQLIAFSNMNFYDGDLITFPSSRTDELGMGVDYYHVEGLFDRRTHTNQTEAKFVVDLIVRHIKEYPNRSLGVVAFSVAQQDLIDDMLAKRRQELPEIDPFFFNESNEPFFIKNLETVQGDERDTIIFSIAYGIDLQGRMLHNFGPLNRVGGERRLNVAITRAKRNVQVVSSMRYTDIDLKRTQSEGVRLLREYLDYAENGKIALSRSIKVRRFEEFDSEFELEVCDFLRENGFSVDTQVGCSGFRIDLGLKRPNSSDYVLAIECDGAAYHSSKSARDRDRLRQQVLEGMGWQFYRIWSTDWFRNGPVERELLLDAVKVALENPLRKGGKVSVSVDNGEFEEPVANQCFEFPAYEVVDTREAYSKHIADFKGMVKEILEVEAPLSEELLLSRIAWCFDRKKVTTFVRQEYEQNMSWCSLCGIIRKDGFLYLENGPEIRFRVPGSIKREIRQIAPEELAAGMLEVVKQNINVSKNGLFRFVAGQCGVTRLTESIVDKLELSLSLLGDSVLVEGDTVSFWEV